MSETEIEEYIIDTKEGKGHFTLRVSLVEERIKLLITSTERPNKKYYNLVRLSQLKEACNAFDKINKLCFITKLILCFSYSFLSLF